MHCSKRNLAKMSVSRCSYIMIFYKVTYDKANTYAIAGSAIYMRSLVLTLQLTMI